MHHLLHSAVDVLLGWSAFCVAVGAVPGFVIGRKSKRNK